MLIFRRNPLRSFFKQICWFVEKLFLCVLSAPSFDYLWRFEYISVLAKIEILHAETHAVSSARSPHVVCSATGEIFLLLLSSDTQHYKLVIKINNYVTQYIYSHSRKCIRV